MHREGGLSDVFHYADRHVSVEDGLKIGAFFPDGAVDALHHEAAAAAGKRFQLYIVILIEHAPRNRPVFQDAAAPGEGAGGKFTFRISPGAGRKSIHFARISRR